MATPTRTASIRRQTQWFPFSALLCAFWIGAVVLQLPEPSQAATAKLGVLLSINNSGNTFSPFTSYQYLYGLQAAVDEANAAGVLGPGNQAKIVFHDVSDNFGGAQSETEDLLFSKNVTAIVLPNYYSAYNAFATAATVGAPVVGAVAADPVAFFSTSARVAVNYRFSFNDESWQMINLALNTKLRCSRFGIFYYNETGVIALKDNAVAQLTGLGHTDISTASYGNNDPAGFELSIQTIMANRPHCVFTLADAQSTQLAAALISQHPSFDPNATFFILPSVGNAPFFDRVMWGRTYIVQQVPSPLKTEYLAVQRYHKAVEALRSKGFYNPPSVKPLNYSGMTGVGYDSRGNYYSLEGYLVGRLTLEVLSRLGGNYSWANFLRVVYKERLFLLDDLTLGPYADGCVGQQDRSGIACFCNSGNKVAYSSYVGDDGLTYSYTPSIGEGSTVEELAMPLSSCTMPDGAVRSPTAFLSVSQLPEAGTNGSAILTTAAMAKAAWYQQMITVTLTVIAESGLIRTSGGDLVAIVVSATSLANSAIQPLVDRYPLTALAGGVQWNGTLNVSGYGTVAGYDLGVYRLTDPTLSQWRQEDIALEPVLADYVHTLAARIADSTPPQARSSVKLTIVATSAAEVELAANSLHTFQLLFDEPMVFASYSGAAAEEQNLRDSLSSRLSGGSTESLFVVSQTPSFVAAVLRFVLTEMPDLRVHFGTSEEALEASLQSLSASERSNFLPQRHNLYFSSVFSGFWYPITGEDTLVKVYYLISAAVGLPNTTLSIAGLRGLRIAIALWTAQDAILGLISATEYLNIWYSRGTFAVLDEPLGPFYNTACVSNAVGSSPPGSSVDRSCQCSKGPRRFFVHSLTNWALRTPPEQSNISYTYVMDTCGAEYQDLMVQKPTDYLPVALAASLIGATLILLVGLGIYLVCRPARDNRYAPKDNKKPFAIAFTDIQSSTSLWARAPQQMAEAVEMHHALIRKLIKAHDGYEVKTIGDSFMVAFADAGDAVRFACVLQSEFFSYSWDLPEINEVYRDLEREKAEEAAGGDGTSESAHFGPESARQSLSVGTPLSHSDGSPLKTRQFSAQSAPDTSKNAAFIGAVLNSLNTTYWNGLRVRVGIHMGHGEIKHDPVTLGYDYYGTVVNTAARVEGVGNGGQVLVTEAAFDAAGGYGPDNAFSDASVTSLGPQPLRGLDEPVVLYQVVPNKLKGREFHALRLDVERDIESETDTDTAGESLSQRSSSMADITPEILAQRAARRMKGDAGYAPALQSMLGMHAFLLQLLAPQSQKGRRQLLEQMAEKWRLQLRKSADKSMTPAQLHERHIMSLVLKVFPSFEKLETAMRLKASRTKDPGGPGLEERQTTDLVAMSETTGAAVESNPSAPVTPQSHEPEVDPFLIGSPTELKSTAVAGEGGFGNGGHTAGVVVLGVPPALPPHRRDKYVAEAPNAGRRAS